jgi:hypothetical protein
MYEKNGEWSGYKITKSEKGFIVSFWSSIQGNITGDKYLYKHDINPNSLINKNTNLNDKYNNWMTYGEYLASTVRELYRIAKEAKRATNIKCLAKGYIVQ